MKETLERLGQDRDSILIQLRRNTHSMKQAAQQAALQGMHAPTIAKYLGVTKRTVYRWIK